jgi:hypothetical protein
VVRHQIIQIMQRALVVLASADGYNHEQNFIQHEREELLKAEMNFVFRVQWSIARV